jgi:uncharacterized protein (DUF427 family)
LPGGGHQKQRRRDTQFENPVTQVRIRHKSSGMLLADGPIGWGITPFEGNFYIRRKFLKTDRFQVNFIPGLCIYKFLYVWLDLRLSRDQQISNLAWMYWLPNPLLPFIWFRVAIPRNHPEIEIEEY